MDPPLHQNDAASSYHHSPSTMCLSSSSDDENDAVSPSAASIQSTTKRLDCMLQFLDRKLTASDHHRNRPAPLPEFVARGGGGGIFRLPPRGAVHPGRPPSLELRPHPLREKQVGRFLRAISGTESQLWAASECGVRFWKLRDLYAYWAEEEEEEGGGGGGVRVGEEESAPFWESVWCPGALCLVAGEGNKVVWSGHKDGRIRCWSMGYGGDGLEDKKWRTPFKECLSWQAHHRGPVLSLTVSSHGW